VRSNNIPLPHETEKTSKHALAEYKAVAGIHGKITSVGSDTLANLMTFWSEGFRKHYPNVSFDVSAQGSSTAPPALIDGTSDMGPMSREMKKEEIDKFEGKYGYKPSRIAVSVDALAVFVHKDNPVKELTLQQVDAIFSSTRKGGYNEDITKWGQVGMTGDWQNANIVLYGRSSVSGTYGFFKSKALFKGDYKDTVKEQPGSSTVVQLVGKDRNAIGYSGIGYKDASVKTVPLAKKPGELAYDATGENAYSGKYPAARYLWVYFNRPEGQPTDPKIREFFRYIHSKQGQEIVVKDGYIPLTQKVVENQMNAYE
jgi:phosphate transport system substrate-binding protein